MKIKIIILMLIASTSFASDYIDTRYCGKPLRDDDGSIHRDRKEVYAFRQNNPCPATGLTDGACKGWNVDHVRPLASCGCDDHNNMQWLPVQIKSCAGEFCKDRWERRVYVCKPVDK